MKKLLVTLCMLSMIACKIIPTSVDANPPVITWENNVFCISEQAFVKADLTQILDSLKAGYTIETPNFSISASQSTLGEITLNVKFCTKTK